MIYYIAGKDTLKPNMMAAEQLPTAGDAWGDDNDIDFDEGKQR